MKKTIIAALCIGLIFVVLGSALILSRIQWLPYNAPVEPPKYVQLQVNVYETSSYWTRNPSSDLPVYMATVAWEVSNFGNKEAKDTTITTYIGGYFWSKTSDVTIQPDQIVEDQFSGLMVNYDQTKTFEVEAACNESENSQTYTITPYFPRSEAEFNGDSHFYQLYVTPNDPTVKSMAESIATNPLIPNWMEIRDWVSNQITYRYDSDVHGTPEYWQLPRETVSMKTGDCEDYAILAVSLLRAAGWKPNDVYVVTGTATENGQTIGHAFVKINILGIWYCWEPQAKNWLIWVLSDFMLLQYHIDGTFNDQYVLMS